MDSGELTFRFSADRAQDICFDIKGTFFVSCISIIPQARLLLLITKKKKKAKENLMESFRFLESPHVQTVSFK